VKPRRENERLDGIFAALADPTRRGILSRLRAGEASVSALAEPFGMSLPAVTKHLRVLERAGLVRHRKSGRIRTIRLAAAPLERAEAWLAQYRIFWERRFDALDAHLRHTLGKET
jgi:DNA-binding transcriptional ArsR family regulator